MPPRLIQFVCTICVLMLLVGTASAAPPPGFADNLVARVPFPTALAFTPDGRMLITSKVGKLYVYQNGALVAAPALDLSAKLCVERERGLHTVAVDPAFASNRFVYIAYTFNRANAPLNQCAFNSLETSPINRVSRFTLNDNNTVDPASERILLDNLPSLDGIHNSGDLRFGQDGYLYISLGDSGCNYINPSICGLGNAAARNLGTLVGKIARIAVTPDGSAIPPDNPFQGAGTTRCNQTGSAPGQKCREIYALGLRNPFRMAFDPNAASTRFFINDVGRNHWEEINLGQAGANYGWNRREGPCVAGSNDGCGPAPDSMINPIYAYDHNSKCKSVTAGAFIPNGIWPGQYNGGYFFGDYVCGKIFVLKESGGRFTASEFYTGLGVNSITTLVFGPHESNQALYYTLFSSGQVRRITYTGNANRPPQAVATANPTFGAAPLNVTFDASGSSDPDGDSLTYEWNFGDNQTGNGAAITHTYAAPGAYNATLIVRDNKGAASEPLVLRIDIGNTPPQPIIELPAEGTRFSVGQGFTLQGSATDPEDGALPGTALTWEVIQHHDDHTHPFLDPTNVVTATITAPEPEDFAATTNSYLEIKLTVTDSNGRSTTVSRNVMPEMVEVTVETVPAGLKLNVNGQDLNGAQKIASWNRYILTIDAPNQNNSAGQPMVFDYWKDNDAPARRTVITPGAPTTLTAVFREASQAPTKRYYVRLPLIGK
jgi:glucose/arabinose dehydrogenase